MAIAVQSIYFSFSFQYNVHTAVEYSSMVSVIFRTTIYYSVDGNGTICTIWILRLIRVGSRSPVWQTRSSSSTVQCSAVSLFYSFSFSSRYNVHTIYTRCIYLLVDLITMHSPFILVYRVESKVVCEQPQPCAQVFLGLVSLPNTLVSPARPTLRP
jgi:predicted membrane protein